MGEDKKPTVHERANVFPGGMASLELLRDRGLSCILAPSVENVVKLIESQFTRAGAKQDFFFFFVHFQLRYFPPRIPKDQDSQVGFFDS